MLLRNLSIALVALTLVVTAQAQSPEPTTADLQAMYMAYLTKEGYRPTVDDDGDVVFKSEGRTYFIDVEADDPGYFRIALPNIWAIESPEERQQVLAACDHSNATAKVAKCYIVRDQVWVGIEVFLANPDDFGHIFARSLSAVNTGTSLFADRMQGK